MKAGRHEERFGKRSQRAAGAATPLVKAPHEARVLALPNDAHHIQPRDRRAVGRGAAGSRHADRNADQLPPPVKHRRAAPEAETSTDRLKTSPAHTQPTVAPLTALHLLDLDFQAAKDVAELRDPADVAPLVHGAPQLPLRAHAQHHTTPAQVPALQVQELVLVAVNQFCASLPRVVQRRRPAVAQAVVRPRAKSAGHADRSPLRQHMHSRHQRQVIARSAGIFLTVATGLSALVR